MPLAGVKILELAQNLAGPYCGQILADLGAAVTKVEPPGGDAARGWGPPFWGGDSPLWLGVNRNKRSMVCDLKHAAGREVVERLLGDSDVVLVASRAGAMERLELGPEHVRARHPNVIYADVMSYGPTGPLSALPGYDPLMQAHAGLMSITGYQDGPPARSGASIVDLTTGMWGAIGVLAALMKRRDTGAGSRVTLALLDSAVALAAHQLTASVATGDVPGRWGSGISMIAPYGAFETRDGQVMITTGSDPTFDRLVEALDMEDVAGDDRFAANAARVEHREELDRRLTAVTQTWSTTALLERLRAHHVPCSAIHDMGEVARDAQVRASGLLRETVRPDTSGYVEIAPPYRLDGQRPATSRPPPRMGEHTDQVLAEAGFSPVEVDSLRAAGAIG